MPMVTAFGKIPKRGRIKIYRISRVHGVQKDGLRDSATICMRDPRYGRAGEQYLQTLQREVVVDAAMVIC